MSTGGGREDTFVIPAILACIAPDPVLYCQPMGNGCPWEVKMMTTMLNGLRRIPSILLAHPHLVPFGPSTPPSWPSQWRSEDYLLSGCRLDSPPAVNCLLSIYGGIDVEDRYHGRDAKD
jgi:hypothetical protein